MKKSSKQPQRRNPTRTTPHQPAIRLPQELILLIIEDRTDSLGDLMNASLVCRDWSRPAQSFIFARIYLRDADQCKKLAQKNPNLLSYVFHLSIIEHPEDGEYGHLGDLVSAKNGRDLSGGSDYLNQSEITDVLVPMLAQGSIRSLAICVSSWTNAVFSILGKFSGIERLRIDGAHALSA
ncbi:hypothetical protein D9758_011834 [Tetrapyrgos nigripes]|uniref:F-box domain-containing protein n=1 Tax=Tetrapyrgos nigripes TaxID=182062 RepID=A0A8H5CLF7_9AGAR|nr:hypothetical protein D9758_011834 [Tetrapyrgos nigripes]